MSLKIAVLLGGTSAERDVSLVSGVEVAKALQSKGHTVEAIDCAFGNRLVQNWNQGSAEIIHVEPSEIEAQKAQLDRNIFKTVDYISRNEFDLVFLALHGGYGENGQLQALLDLAGVPYAGCGYEASVLAMDKHFSKIMFEKAGVPTAPWVLLQSPDEFRPEMLEPIGFPVVVKPNDQGSTVGLTIADSLQMVPEAVKLAFRYSKTVMLEKFIPGRELTVPVLGDQALPVIEIIPEHGIYDYECKYQSGKSRYVVPAKLPDHLTQKVSQYALKAFRELRCRDYARIDFRLFENSDRLFCLEVNSLPGMTPTSLVPKSAKATGLDFPELVEKIARFAIER